MNETSQNSEYEEKSNDDEDGNDSNVDPYEEMLRKEAEAEYLKSQ